MNLPVRLSFDLTTDMLRDIDRFFVQSGSHDRWLAAQRSKNIRRQILQAPLWFLAGLGVWRLIEPLLHPQDSGGLALGIILAAIMPLLLVVSDQQVETARRRLLRDMAGAPGRGLACTGRIAVEITERALVYQDQWTRAEFAWPLVSSAGLTGEYLVIMTFSRRMIVIPCGCLSPDLPAKTVIETVNHLHEQAGGPAEVIIEHLRDNSCPCPGCGYDMRGAKTLDCPECARVFRFEDLGIE